MGSRTAMLRNKIADYIKIGNDYELCGVGFTQLNESPGAQTDSTTYINEVTTSTSITGYKTEFSYESDLIPSQKAVLALYNVGRNHITGEGAEFDYIRVDVWNPVGTPTTELAEYKARLFKVANETSDIEGDGGEKISVSGTLHAIGDPVQGKFDVISKTFTAGDFVGKYDDGEQPVTPSITLDKLTLTVAEGADEQIAATTVPVDAEVTWTSSDTDVATVAAGTVSGVAAGTARITASITVDGVTKTAFCDVTVTA